MQRNYHHPCSVPCRNRRLTPRRTTEAPSAAPQTRIVSDPHNPSLEEKTWQQKKQLLRLTQRKGIVNRVPPRFHSYSSFYSCSRLMGASEVIISPCLSRLSNGIGLKLAQDSLSEWLRRQTRNLLGSARASSNPAAVAFLLLFSFLDHIISVFISFFFIKSLLLTTPPLFTSHLQQTPRKRTIIPRPPCPPRPSPPAARSPFPRLPSRSPRSPSRSLRTSPSARATPSHHASLPRSPWAAAPAREHSPSIPPRR